MTHFKKAFRTGFPAAAAVVALIAGSMVACGSDDPVFSVRGFVSASNNLADPIAGVTASCPGTEIADLTGSDGMFELTCPMPTAPADGPAHAAMIWISHPGLAPVARTFVPVADGVFTVTATMNKERVDADVEIPAGNTSVPVLLDALTLSFERETLLDAAGTPIAGSFQFQAAAWDNSLPVEVDESSGDEITDALFPPLTRLVLDQSGSSAWMRPVAASWFDLGEARINADKPLEMKLLSRFANEVAGRDIGNEDANLFLIDAAALLPGTADGVAMTAVNQLSLDAVSDGLAVWLVPVSTHACVNVTVTKGENPVTGAQVTLYETFGGELELFSDEQIGAADGVYCLAAAPGKQVRAVVSLAGASGISRLEADLLSGGEGSCGGQCATTSLNFPCEINEDCAEGNLCDNGSCVPPVAG